MTNNSKHIICKSGFISELELSDSNFLKNKEFAKYHLSTNSFLNVPNPLKLCRMLKCNFEDMQELILKADYAEFEIPKKNRTVRKIQAPNEKLKKVQERLNHLLQVYYYFWNKPEFVHGFVIRPLGESKMCNIVSNAQSHVGKKYVLNIDLKDFFSSITTKRVLDFFQSDLFNYTDNIAKSLTFLCTYKGFLPTGAPTSPVISNFICLEMDKELKTFCHEHQVNLSRYADDLTFSSNSEFTPTFIEEIKTIIEKHNLHINPRKVFIKKSNSKQTVTGLIVNEKVNIDRKLLKKVRAMMHNLNTKGLNDTAFKHFNGLDLNSKNISSSFLNQLDGYINFIGQVRGKEDVLYLKFRHELKKNLLKH